MDDRSGMSSTLSSCSWMEKAESSIQHAGDISGGETTNLQPLGSFCKADVAEAARDEAALEKTRKDLDVARTVLQHFVKRYQRQGKKLHDEQKSVRRLERQADKLVQHIAEQEAKIKALKRQHAKELRRVKRKQDKEAWKHVRSLSEEIDRLEQELKIAKEQQQQQQEALGTHRNTTMSANELKMLETVLLDAQSEIERLSHERDLAVASSVASKEKISSQALLQQALADAHNEIQRLAAERDAIAARVGTTETSLLQSHTVAPSKNDKEDKVKNEKIQPLREARRKAEAKVQAAILGAQEEMHQVRMARDSSSPCSSITDEEASDKIRTLPSAPTPGSPEHASESNQVASLEQALSQARLEMDNVKDECETLLELTTEEKVRADAEAERANQLEIELAQAKAMIQQLSKDPTKASPNHVEEIRCLETALWEAETGFDRLQKECDAIMEVSEMERRRLIAKHQEELTAMEKTLLETKQEMQKLAQAQDAAEQQYLLEKEDLLQQLADAQSALEAQKENRKIMKDVYETMLQDHKSSLVAQADSVVSDTTIDTTTQELTNKVKSLEASLADAQNEIERLSNQRDATIEYAKMERDRMVEEHRHQMSSMERALEDIEAQVHRLEQIQQQEITTTSTDSSVAAEKAPPADDKLHLESTNEEGTRTSRFWAFANTRAKQ